MIRTYYRRPDAGDAPAPMFDPAGPDPAALIDPLTGAVPTWRLDEEPIYLETVRDKGIPGLGAPAAGDVVEGVVVEGPPTVALSLVGPATRPLPLVEVRGASKRTRKRAARQRREAGSAAGSFLVFVGLLVACVVLAVLSFGQGIRADVEDKLPACVVPTSAGCPDGPQP